MAWIPDGTFLMGSDCHYPEERPAHRVTVSARFVTKTGYLTVAERALDAHQGPGGLVFRKPAGPVDLSNDQAWWPYVACACWRCPGKSLPTEAEWEFAARDGLEAATYVWGNELTPNGRYVANTWQGHFPWHNSCLDGYEGLAPVASFPPNGYGLYEMAGNVWEWTSDWYANPQEQRKVLKGGSYLCAPNYCRRYRPAARFPQTMTVRRCDIGFRCVARIRCGSG
jgi:formylglycine-generating enzyme required for sulfatase activity